MPRTTGSALAQRRRIQANLTLTKSSPLHPRFLEATELTGLTPSQILRALAWAYLDRWVKEEVERRRQHPEAAERADVAKIVDQGPASPRYRGDAGPGSRYLEAVALRVPIEAPIVAIHRNVAVVEEPDRPPLRETPPVLLQDEEAALG